jgi:hypothetical protein
VSIWRGAVGVRGGVPIAARVDCVGVGVPIVIAAAPIRARRLRQPIAIAVPIAGADCDCGGRSQVSQQQIC